jgi:hypothetical protein
MLMYNGIMVGVFQYFYFRQNLLFTSSLTIWLHGTLEISAMILSTAAGIVMGRGLIFPGTHTRFQSFFLSAREGIKIFLGIIPIVIIAAIIESFLTRYTEAPVFLKAGLILLSLGFIIIYFVWYPNKKNKEQIPEGFSETGLHPMKDIPFYYDEINSNGTIFIQTFSLYRKLFPQLLKWGTLISIISSVIFYFITNSDSQYNMSNLLLLLKIFNYSSNPGYFLINTGIFSVIIFTTMKFCSRIVNPDFKAGTSEILKGVFFAAFINSFFFFSQWLSISLVIVVGPFVMQWLSRSFFEKKNIAGSIVHSFILLDAALGKAWGFFLVTILFSILYYFIIDAPIIIFYSWIFSWNLSAEGETMSMINLFLNYLISFFLITIIIPIILIGNFLEYFTLKEIFESNGLIKKIRSLKMQ